MNSVPGYTPRPAPPPDQSFGLVYEVSVQSDRDQHLLTLTLWEDERSIATHTIAVRNFVQHVEMTSAYLMATTDRIERSNFPGRDPDRDPDVQASIDFLGQTIYNLLTPDDESRRMWEQFIDRALQRADWQGIILVHGAAVTTWPVETLADSWRSKFGGRLAVVKGGNRIGALNGLLGVAMSPTLVLVYGSPRVTGAATLSPLDYRDELTRILRVLSPDGMTSIEDEVSRALSFGGDFRRGESRCIVVGQGADLDRVSKVVSKINGPYVLVYSGHGHRPNYSNDGIIYLPGPSGQMSVTHREIAEHLKVNPPYALIFNCCESVRIVDPYPPGALHEEWQGLEDEYSTVHREGLGMKLVFGNRTNIHDEHGIALAESVARTVLWGGNWMDLVASLFSSTSVHVGATTLRKSMALRDRVTGTVLALHYDD